MAPASRNLGIFLSQKSVGEPGKIRPILAVRVNEP